MLPPCDVQELDFRWCIASPCSRLARESETMDPPHSSLEDLTFPSFLSRPIPALCLWQSLKRNIKLDDGEWVHLGLEQTM